MLDNYHIVLVEPQESLNIGSVARAMMNLGFSKLHLVAPSHYDYKRACITARNAGGILDTARIYDCLADAVASMEEIVGLSMRAGRNRPEHLILGEWVEQHRALGAAETALVFGPEDSGLRQEHIERCRWLVKIPANDEYPSFNLAQAVLLVLYELSRDVPYDASNRQERELPTARDFEQLDLLLADVARKSGFYHEGTPQPLPSLMKSLLRRIDPDKREMNILLGLFGNIRNRL